MARLPYIDPETAPEPVRDAFTRLPIPLNIFRMMAHAETCFRPLLRLGNSILGHQQLDARLRELAILQVAKLSSGEYEWVQHVPIAEATGVTDAQLRALDRGVIDGSSFDPAEIAVLRFTTEVVQQVKASDRTFAEVQKHLVPREIVELILAVGYYMTMARITETTDTDLDQPSGTRIVDAVE
jgi:alkylhydroperoxidase family enzyme